MMWQKERPADKKAEQPAWLLGFFLVAITVMAYQPVWHAGFIWDDDEFVTNNPAVKSVDGLYRLWFTATTADYYPMTLGLFWLEWRLWANHPLGYHLVNILLHAFCAMLLWRIVHRLRIPGALLAAAIFALHPINVESAAWISEGKNTLAMLFYLSTLWAWLQFEDSGRGKWYGLALVAFALGLLSKTAVAPLPLVLLGMAWWRRERVEWRDVRRVGLFFVMVAVWCPVTVWLHYHRAIGGAVVRTDGFWSRLAGAGWAVWFYLYKAVLPLNLIFVYPRWHIDAGNVLSYIPLLMLVVAFVVCWRRRSDRGRALFFGLAYFVVMLLPVLGFLNIYFMLYSLVADHWEYFAIIGPIVLAAAAIRKPALAAALLLALGALTWQQCRMYVSDETLWQTTLRRNPDCWMAHNNLGLALCAEGRRDKAMAQYQQALAIKPDYPEAHNNLGTQLDAEGKQDEAILHLQAALASRPQYDQAHYNLGLIYLAQGRIDSAIAQFRSAIAINPQYDIAFANLGMAFARQGHLDEAVAQYRQALAIAPDNAYAHNALGRALEAANKLTEAAAEYAAAVSSKPSFAEAHENLGAVLTLQGNFAQAEDQFAQALKLQPASPSIHYNLGNALVRQNKLRAAAAQFSEAVQLQPDYLEAHFNLALTLSQLGQTADAIQHYRKALGLATASGQKDLAEKIQTRLQLYQSSAASHEPIRQ